MTDGTIESFLSGAGVGTDFPKYVGELKKLLTELIDVLLEAHLGIPLERLGRFLGSLGTDRKKWTNEQLSKAWVAVMTMMSLSRDDIAAVVPQKAVEDIEGRWQTVLKILAKKNIHVLAGGTIERYLPAFTGNPWTRSHPRKKTPSLLNSRNCSAFANPMKTYRRRHCWIAMATCLKSSGNYLPERRLTSTGACAST